MPYSSNSELPPGVKALPKHGQDIYRAAFNSAYDQYKDEAKAHATAWAAVKGQYKKVGDEWVAKESKMEVKEAMSDNDKRALLQAAVMDSLAIGANQPGPWIRDMYDTEVVYEVGGKTFRMSYVIDRKGKVVFGQAERVVPQTVYTPVQEAVDAKINQLAEAGANRVEVFNLHAVNDNLMKLLEKAKLTEAEAAPVLAEADVLIKKLAEAAPAKTEDGEQYPKAAFAYVPDPEKPSTWKLRLWEDPEKKVTRRQLGAAAAALSPGGFRGQKVQIPSEDLSTVKRKIRGAYRALDVPDEEIPRWVKEAESRELIAGYIALTEAKVDGKGTATVEIIQPGFNTSFDRYYPEEMLKRDLGIFEGVKMYADHPSENEEKERPERSIRDWVATLKGVYFDEAAGKVKGKAHIVESWMKEKLSTLRDKGLLETMGISINAIGTASKAKIDGRNTMLVERLVRARSVDFVTEAGAGGAVALYEAASDSDIDLVDEARLRERRPDLVVIIESAVKDQINTEVKSKMETEQKVKDLEAQVITLTTERDTLKEAAAKAEKDKAKADAQAAIKDAVGKAELPEAAKTRLLEAHKEDETAEGIEVVIQSEVAYIAALTEKGKVKGLGPSSEPDPKTQEKLEEAFTELTGSKEAGKVAARGR